MECVAGTTDNKKAALWRPWIGGKDYTRLRTTGTLGGFVRDSLRTAPRGARKKTKSRISAALYL